MATSRPLEDPANFPRFESTVEATPRWVRVKFGNEIIADSKQVLLLLQYGPGGLPTYYFPREDVRQELLEKGSDEDSTGEMAYYTLKVGDETAEKAAWVYQEPPASLKSLNGYFSFKWGEGVRWYEEEEEVYEHARDPHHRVDVMPSSRHVQVVINGETVADTHQPRLLFETSLPTRYYIPREDVRMDLLAPETLTSRCPYKGVASYWSVQAGDKKVKNLVWGYAEPISECPKIKGLVCFFNERVDLYLDGELVTRPNTPWSRPD